MSINFVSGEQQDLIHSMTGGETTCLRTSTLHVQFSEDQNAQRKWYPKLQPTISWLELIEAQKFKQRKALEP